MNGFKAGPRNQSIHNGLGQAVADADLQIPRQQLHFPNQRTQQLLPFSLGAVPQQFVSLTSVIHCCRGIKPGRATCFLGG